MNLERIWKEAVTQMKYTNSKSNVDHIWNYSFEQKREKGSIS
jgi:hypothetical protein